MSQRTENICLDADRLSLDYLIAERIWDPADNGRDDAETLHPELLRHLTRETVERRDFTLRFGQESYNRRSASHTSSNPTKIIGSQLPNPYRADPSQRGSENQRNSYVSMEI